MTIQIELIIFGPKKFGDTLVDRMIPIYKCVPYLQVWCLSPEEVKLESNFLSNFSKTAERKQTTLVEFVAQLETRVILRNEPNSCILQELIAKIMYRTK